MQRYKSILIPLVGFIVLAIAAFIARVHVKNLDSSLSEIVNDLDRYSKKVENAENAIARGVYVDVYNERIREYRTLLNSFPNQLLNDWFLDYPNKAYLQSHMMEYIQIDGQETTLYKQSKRED